MADYRGTVAELSPNYANPPLIEVALAVEFPALENFGAIQMASLANEWREEFPIAQEHPPLAAISPVGLNSSLGPEMVVNMGAPQLRLWLLTSSQDRLIQIQRDRLILNWRAATDANPYPRYRETLRSEFMAVYEMFVSALQAMGAGRPRPASVEVSYVNAIAHEAGAPADLSKTLVSFAEVSLSVGTPVVTRFNQIWNISHENGLVSTVNLNVDTQGLGGEAIFMGLTGRSAVKPASSTSDVFEALDASHLCVVTTFDELTSDARHEEWGKL